MNKISYKLVHGFIALALLGNIFAIMPAYTFVVNADNGPQESVEDTTLTATTPFEEGKARMTVDITAYSSTVDQTDDTPFITASGAHVADGIVAANFLPLHTRVKIPELFGEKVFVVEDRMNRRYQQRMDIWMETREAARKFGLKRAEIVVLY
jgi:3D (Asp-Asp-Asp) domain-containing protein